MAADKTTTGKANQGYIQALELNTEGEPPKTWHIPISSLPANFDLNDDKAAEQLRLWLAGPAYPLLNEGKIAGAVCATPGKVAISIMFHVVFGVD